MLRKRLITVLTFNDGVLFRTKLFQPDYRYTLNFVDAWSVDEIVALDVTRPGTGNRENFYAAVSQLARRCFVPLTAGGGVRGIDDVDKLMSIGADKVLVNTGALHRPGLIGDIARTYGAQCVVVGMDAKPVDGGYRVFSDFATVATNRTAEEWAAEAQAAGAGEILVTAIEHDGWLQGYDLELTRRVVQAVDVPVLALGGCGNWQHAVDLFTRTDVSAACTQNIYHFTDSAIRSAKAYLHKSGIHVRL